MSNKNLNNEIIIDEQKDNEANKQVPLQKNEHSLSDTEKTELIKLRAEKDSIKFKFKTYLIMAITILFTINILSGTFVFLFMRHKTNSAINSAAVHIAENMENIITEDIRNQITDDFLKSYLRERYLPEDYVSIGLYVNSQAQKSVVEVQCGTTAPTVKSTGLIINDEGYVLTNAHNITYSSEILGGSIDNPITIIEYTVYPLVQTKVYGSSQLYNMTVISYDVDLDLAILKFHDFPEGLDYAKFSHHDAITPGEEIVLIGNALGLGITVSTGTVLGTYNYNNLKMVQLDALALKGNSGAPVFNIYAEVIGLMSFKITEEAQEQVSGIGYSVSVFELIEYIKKVNLDQNITITYTLVDYSN